MPQHETFYAIRRAPDKGSKVFITVLHEVPADAVGLGSFDDLGAAIEFAQQEARRLTDRGEDADYVDPPDNLVGTG